MKIRMMAYTALFTALIAIGAYIRIPIPYVPLTLQLQFVNLAAILLGKKYGTAAVGAYIAVGLAGAPVFAGGGGIGYVTRPTFGYIIGFLAGAYLAGLVSSKKFTFRNLLTASIINVAVIYAIGAAYFYFITKYYEASPVSAGFLFLYCFALTAPFDVAMCFVSARLSLRILPYVRRRHIKGDSTSLS